MAAICGQLSATGVTSFRILDENFRKSLLHEATCYQYKPEEEIVGSKDRTVRQQLESFKDFPDESQFILLKNSFQALVDRGLEDLPVSPFETRLRFSSLVLQKYRKGSVGITPHRDRLRYVNLVCVFNIGGRGRFYVCPDRSGSDAREVDTSPGRVVLIRAPGFLGSRNRVFHFVRDVEETRYTFGLRQERA